MGRFDQDLMVAFRALVALLLVCAINSSEVQVVELDDAISTSVLLPRAVLGESNATQNATATRVNVTQQADVAAKAVKEKAAKDPAVVQEDVAIEKAKKDIASAEGWTQNMKGIKKSKKGCPCPGRDFQIKTAAEETPTKRPETTGAESANITRGNSSKTVAVNVEDVGALVQHYIKKFSHFSSWQKPDDKLLAKTGKQLIKATKDTKGKLKGALKDFAKMKVDPKFADWMVDMCPCPNADGYEEMMTAYMKTRTPTSSLKLNKHWYKDILEVYKKKMRAEQVEEEKAQEDAAAQKKDAEEKNAQELAAAKKQQSPTTDVTA